MIGAKSSSVSNSVDIPADIFAEPVKSTRCLVRLNVAIESSIATVKESKNG